MRIVVARCAYNQDSTLGLLQVGGQHVGYSLERPWKNNRDHVSCIPEGEYDLEVEPPHESSRFDYNHLKLLDVPGRTEILIHRANRVDQIEGCIAPGRSAGPGFVGHSETMLSDLVRRVQEAQTADVLVTHVGLEEPGHFEVPSKEDA